MNTKYHTLNATINDGSPHVITGDNLARLRGELCLPALDATGTAAVAEGRAGVVLRGAATALDPRGVARCPGYSAWQDGHRRRLLLSLPHFGHTGMS